MGAVDVARELITLARAEGRDVLLETEVYQILDAGGLRVPAALAIQPGERIPEATLRHFRGDRVMLKVASPAITHKTELGGVASCPRDPDEIAVRSREMLETVRARGGDAIADSVAWIQVTERIEAGRELGDELFVGLRNSREFGPILAAGLGGVDTEELVARFRPGGASEMNVTLLGAPERFMARFKQTFAYAAMAGRTRGGRCRVRDEDLLEIFRFFFALGQGLMPGDGGEGALLELEVNPFLVVEGGPVAADGFFRFGRDHSLPAPTPIEGIRHLLEPATVALVGVSARDTKNPGRIILRNLLREHFPLDAVRVVRPGGGAVDGVACVDSLDALPWVADMMVLAVGAAQVPDLIEQVIAGGRARSIVLISGGMEETEHGKEAAARISGAMARARAEGRPCPVIVGPNCLGVRSRPGRFDTLFIPQTKLPPPKGGIQNSALVFQSGALMITNMNELAFLDPVFAISTGNQMDLSATDFVRYLAGDPRIEVIALYIDGFGELEGLEMARAIRGATRAGKDVLVYKAGRTQEGRSATSSHTASVAGDYDVAVAGMEQAGAIVADTFTQFRGLLMLACLLRERNLYGPGLALMSNAGYETIGMADNIDHERGFRLAKLLPETKEQIRRVLREAGIENLVTVKNPLDVTPMASDEVHVAIARALLDDPDVGGLVMGFVPLTPAMQTLPPGLVEGDSIDAPGSLTETLLESLSRSKKPVVTVVHGGRLYDDMVGKLFLDLIPCFRRADEAMGVFQKYIHARLTNIQQARE
jgi:acyl-CoA synthetase (NDP forming)